MYARLGRLLGLPSSAVNELSASELHGGSLPTDPTLARYERCQVRWASEEESRTRYGGYGKEVVWHRPTVATRIRSECDARSSLVWTWRTPAPRR
jgi:hypothetical protein